MIIWKELRHNPQNSHLSIGDMLIDPDPNWGAGMIIKAEIREGQKKKDPKDKILVTDDEWRYLIRFPKVTRKIKNKFSDEWETKVGPIERWWYEKNIRQFINNKMLKLQRTTKNDTGTTEDDG